VRVRLFVPAAAMLVGLSVPAAAQAIGGCDPAVLQGPAFTQCLTTAEKRSTDQLSAVVAAALGSIATRKGIYDSQRGRWRNSLTASQNSWIRFRNDECQNVAPFEGQSGSSGVLQARTAAFDAKMICAITMNSARAADLARRYSLDPSQPGQTP